MILIIISICNENIFYREITLSLRTKFHISKGIKIIIEKLTIGYHLIIEHKINRNNLMLTINKSM